jgi:transcriptional regulator with XRE-family HTH domain
MARPLLRGDRLQAAREAMGLTREELATRLELSSPARIRVWELGLERPRPRFIPRLAAVLDVSPYHLLDVDPGDPPLAALRLAAGFATNELTGSWPARPDCRSALDRPAAVGASCVCRRASCCHGGERAVSCPRARAIPPLARWIAGRIQVVLATPRAWRCVWADRLGG